MRKFASALLGAVMLVSFLTACNGRDKDTGGKTPSYTNEGNQTVSTPAAVPSPPSNTTEPIPETEFDIPSNIQVETVDYYENNVLLPELKSQSLQIGEREYGQIWFTDENLDREEALLVLPFSVSNLEDWDIEWQDDSRYSNFTMTKDNETIKGWKVFDATGEDVYDLAMRASHEIVFDDYFSADVWISGTTSPAMYWYKTCFEHFDKYDTFYGNTFEAGGYDGKFYRIYLDENRKIHLYSEIGRLDYSKNQNRFYIPFMGYDFFNTNSIGAGRNNENLEEALIKQAKYIKNRYFYDTNLDESRAPDNYSLEYTFDANTNTLTGKNHIRDIAISFERDDENKVSTAIFTEKTVEFTDEREFETRLIGTKLNIGNVREIIRGMERKYGEAAWSIDNVSVFHRSNLKYTINITLNHTENGTYYAEQNIRLDAKDVPVS